MHAPETVGRGKTQKPDLTSLVAGVALLVLGAMLLLHAVEAIELRFGILAPVACAATGAILVASGMSRRR